MRADREEILQLENELAVDVSMDTAMPGEDAEKDLVEGKGNPEVALDQHEGKQAVDVSPVQESLPGHISEPQISPGVENHLENGAAFTSKEVESEKDLVKDQLMEVPCCNEPVVEALTDSAFVEKEIPQNSDDDCICLGGTAPVEELCSQRNLADASKVIVKEEVLVADEDLGVSEWNSCQDTNHLDSSTEMYVGGAPKSADKVTDQECSVNDEVQDEKLCEAASAALPSHCQVDVDMSDAVQDSIVHDESAPEIGSDLDKEGEAGEGLLLTCGPQCAAREALQSSPSDCNAENLVNRSDANVLCKNVPCMAKTEGQTGDTVEPNDFALEGPSLAAAAVQEDKSDSEQSVGAFPHRRTLRRKKRVVRVIDSEEDAASVSDFAGSQSSSQRSRGAFDDEAEVSPPHFGDDDEFPSDCEKPRTSDTDESLEEVGDFFDAEAEESLGDDDRSESGSEKELPLQEDDDFINDDDDDNDGDRSSRDEEYFRHSRRKRYSSSDPSDTPEYGKDSPEVQPSGGEVELAEKGKGNELGVVRYEEDVEQEESGKENRHSHASMRGEEESSKNGVDLLESNYGAVAAGREMKTSNGEKATGLQSQGEEDEETADAKTSSREVETTNGSADQITRLINRLLTTGAITVDEASLLRLNRGKTNAGAEPVDGSHVTTSAVTNHRSLVDEKLEVPVSHDPELQRGLTTDPLDKGPGEKLCKERKRKKKQLDQGGHPLEDCRSYQGIDRADGAQDTPTIQADGPEEVCMPHPPKQKRNKKDRSDSTVDVMGYKQREPALLVLNGDAEVKSATCQAVVSEENDAAEMEESGGRKKERRSKKHLTDPRLESASFPGPLSVQLHEGCLHNGVSKSKVGGPHSLKAKAKELGLESDGNAPLSDIRREKMRRKKRKSKGAEVEKQQREARDKGDSDDQDEGPLLKPTELEPVVQNSVVVQDLGGTEELFQEESPVMGLLIKKRKKRQEEVEQMEDCELPSVGEQVSSEKPRKKKKKRKNISETASEIPVAQTEVSGQPQGDSVAELEATEANDKIERKKKKSDTKAASDTKEAAVVPQNDASLIETEVTTKPSLKRKRRKGSQKTENAPRLRVVEPEEPNCPQEQMHDRTEQVTASVAGAPVEAETKLSRGRKKKQRKHEQFVRLEPDESVRSKSPPNELTGKQEIQNDSVPGPMAQKHRRKKKSRKDGETAVDDLDGVTMSEEPSQPQEDGIESIWKRYLPESPAKPAREPSSLRKKKKKKSKKIEQEPMSTRAEADMKDDEATWDNIWKQYIAQTPEKPPRSPRRERRVAPGKKVKLARSLVPSEEPPVASTSPKRKKKRKLRKV